MNYELNFNSNFFFYFMAYIYELRKNTYKWRKYLLLGEKVLCDRKYTKEMRKNIILEKKYYCKEKILIIEKK